MFTTDMPGLEGLEANWGPESVSVHTTDNYWIPPRGRHAWYIGINFERNADGKIGTYRHLRIDRYEEPRGFITMQWEQQSRVVKYIRDKLNEYLAEHPELDNNVRLEGIRSRLQLAERNFQRKREELWAATEELEAAKAELDAFDFTAPMMMRN